MPEKKSEKLRPAPEFIAPKDVAPVVVDVSAMENPEAEIISLKEKAKEVFEGDYKQALDISIMRQMFVENPETKEIITTFTLHGKNEKGDERQEDFKAVYTQDRQYINVIITPAIAGDMKIGGTYEQRRGKQMLGLGVHMHELTGYGFYSQIMDGLLRGVDITENAFNNDEVAEVYKNYSAGDYSVPSVFAARAQLAAARKGFLCFVEHRSTRGDAGEAGLYFIGVRAPKELQEVLEKAKWWERGNAICDEKVEAAKIQNYIESVKNNEEALARDFGFYQKQCMKLLAMQVERFEDMAKGIDKYPLKPKNGTLAPAPPQKSWLRRILGWFKLIG